MSRQNVDPDHKRKMVEGVLAAALLFSVVIGSKLNTSQLSAQVVDDDADDGCYYSLVDTYELVYCDEIGCYYPDGFWYSNDKYLPSGIYKEGTDEGTDPWIHPDYGKNPYIMQYYRPAAEDEGSAYEIFDSETCLDENGLDADGNLGSGDDMDMDDMDMPDDGGDQEEYCEEVDRGDQTCNVCYKGKEQR